MQELLGKKEFAGIKKLFGNHYGVGKLRYLKFDYKNKQVVMSDGYVLLVLTDRLPNDLARTTLGITEDLLLPYWQVRSMEGIGRVSVRTLQDTDEEAENSIVPLLKVENLNGAMYVLIDDFVSGHNDYIDYRSALDGVQIAKQNALFADELPTYGVSKMLKRLEEGLIALDSNANLQISKEYITAEGFIEGTHRQYEVCAKTPAKHESKVLHPSSM